jgi:hypothetical protein
MRITEWPLEFVKYDASRNVLTAYTRDGYVDIIHGDGTWIVFKAFDDRPWSQTPCVVPAGIVWGALAESLGAWSGSANAHGLAHLLGKLPDGTVINDANGNLSPQAKALLDTLAAIASGETDVGLLPNGAEAQFVANGSTAWQVFDRLAANREKAAHRIYNGTDAQLGSVGGSPGVDIAELFGIATTILQGDLDVIERGINTGLIQPWTAINYGDTRMAPAWEYQIPDRDEDAKHEENSKGYERLTSAVKTLREQKFEVTQADVDHIAALLGVDPPPRLASIEQQTNTIVLAPTDVAKIVRVREARASQGLPPFGDERDDLTLSELDALATAKATEAAARLNRMLTLSYWRQRRSVNKRALALPAKG